ncbi:MAG: SDR family oxidoreductase [Rhizobiales bacterium]|nr:SDR family oxidoreductase [Hyphomicrobiales bacterium]NRB14978.1 SDR family oxidoreductase [Hyphomicrobiales bacterium]
MDFGLNGKTALVLGASRGLGAAIAQGLAKEGVKVYAAARSHEQIEQWAKELNITDHVTAISLDLTDIDAINKTIESILENGGVDILVNNTGGPPPSLAHETPRDNWIGNFEVMAANIFHITQKLLPNMRQKNWGRIISLTSSGVEQPIPRLAISNAIRSAIVGWSKTLSAEVAADGVTVNVIMPGRIKTKRLDQLDSNAAERTGKSIEDVAKASMATIPAARYGTPEEFANVAVFLASEAASYVTGSKIRIDGGAIKSV